MTVSLWVLLGLVVIAPFERPLATLATFTITTVEAAILAALAVVACATLMTNRRLRWRTSLLRPGIAFLVVLLVAAVVAPLESGNALRFVARMAVAAAVFLLALNAVDSQRQGRLLVIMAVAVATVVAAIAVLESAQVGPVMNGLRAFRPGFHVVAGQLRATSTLFYPTIASMYLEVAFALGLWLLLDPRTRAPRLERAAVFAALSVVGAGITATFTRAGLLAMAASIVVVGAMHMSRSRQVGSVRLLAALTLVLGAIVMLSHSPELLATRITTEGSQDWYGARYEVPSTLRFETAREYHVPITLENRGRLTWDSSRDPAFAMSYHWTRAGSEAVVQFDGQRTAFETPVVPGAVVDMRVGVRAPGQPGTYTLVWDVVHETRAWLSTEGVPPGRTTVHVTGAPAAPVTTMLERLPSPTRRLTRPALWNAALGIAAERPLLGVGPDNFRHLYGRYAGLQRWDDRVHANNMYLEALTGAGVLGCAALLWLVSAAGVDLWRRWRAAPAAYALPLAAAIASWLVIAGHGLVDSFLSFTTTYLTFAIAAGLAFSPGIHDWDGSGAQGAAADEPRA
jgi:O-antigen ligase